MERKSSDSWKMKLTTARQCPFLVVGLANMISLHRVEFCMTISTREAVCILPLVALWDYMWTQSWRLGGGWVRKNSWSYWIHLACEVGNAWKYYSQLFQTCWHQAQLPSEGKHDQEAYKDHLCTLGGWNRGNHGHTFQWRSWRRNEPDKKNWCVGSRSGLATSFVDLQSTSIDLQMWNDTMA